MTVQHVSGYHEDLRTSYRLQYVIATKNETDEEFQNDVEIGNFACVGIYYLYMRITFKAEKKTFFLYILRM